MVELQINRNMKSTRAVTNGMDENIELNQNGTDSNDEYLDDVNYAAADEDNDDRTEVLPIKRTKLDVPKFLRKQPARVTWHPIEQQKPEKNLLGIESICPNVCFFFLRDDCIEGEKCYYSHELPSDSEVGRALAECGVKNAAKLLNVIIARCPKLLLQFFHVFVTFFADQNSKDELIEAIAICQRETDNEKQFQYFQHLIGAFIRIGEPYESAMQQILWNIDYNKQGDVADSLLNMDLVDGIGVGEFLDVLNSLNENHFYFNEIVINRLMLLCTQSENALPTGQLVEFARLIYNILRNNKPKLAQRILDRKQYNDYIQLYNRIRKAH